MAHIRTQIADRLLRGFAVHPERIVQIPQCRQIVADETFKEGAQPGGVGENSDGLHQQRGLILFGSGQCGVEECPDFFFGIIVFGSGFDTDKGGVEPFCRIQHQYQLQ